VCRIEEALSIQIPKSHHFEKLRNPKICEKICKKFNIRKELTIIQVEPYIAGGRTIVQVSVLTTSDRRAFQTIIAKQSEGTRNW
jgi:hypothetical protein